MKKYSSWLWVVMGSIFLLISLAALIGKYLYINPVYNQELFKLEPSTSTLIIGASHSATALDPDYIDDALNVASSGEPLFFTYYKTKALLKINPQIKHLVVAISPIHIGSYAEKQLFQGNSASRKYAMDYYFLVDDLSDPLIQTFSSDNIIAYLKFHWGMPFNYMSDLKVVVNYYRNKVTFTDYSFFGGVERVDGNHIEPNRQRAKAEFYFLDEINQINPSNVGIEVIHRIANLSKEFDVTLSIVSTPMHPYFISQIPDSIQNKYDEVIYKVTSQNPKVNFIDLSNLPMAETKFLDGDHLNTQGATEFSKLLFTKYIIK